MIRTVVREPLFWLIAVVYIAWLSCSVAMGQSSAGVFVRHNCGTITNPVSNETYCFHAGPTIGEFNQGNLYVYAGAAWSCKTCSAGGDQNIEQVFTQGRIATNLTDYANRAQFGNASNQGTAMYSDGVIAPSRITCIVGGVEDACDKVVGLLSGYKWGIEDSDGTEPLKYTDSSRALTWRERGSDPSSPASSTWELYFKSTGLFYKKSDGTVTGPLGTGGSSTAVGAKVRNSAAQTITTSTETAISFDTELYDTDSIHSTVSNTSRLTIPSSGKWSGGGCIKFADNGTGIRQIYIVKNGDAANTLAKHRTDPTTGDESEMCVPFEDSFSTNDYVELWVYQTSGGDLDSMAQSPYAPSLWIHKVGA